MLQFEETVRMRVFCGERYVDVLAYCAVDAKLQAMSALDLPLSSWDGLRVAVHNEDKDKVKKEET